MVDKVKIEIPRANEKEVVIVPSGSNLGDINKKIKDISQIVMSINLVVVLSLVAIIISVIGLFLDQMRFNNTVYKECSQKTDSVEMTQKINQEVLEKNAQNQERVIKQQNQIIELLNKK